MSHGRSCKMGRKEDDERAYRTSEDMVGRSIRRGTRKAISVLTLGLIGAGDPISNLAADAAQELPEAIRRSRESKDD